MTYLKFVLPFAPLALILASCQSNSSAPAPDSTTTTASTAGDVTLVADGKKVFQANRCMGCHMVANEGGGRGPDLTHVGGEPGHTTDWLIAHVKNPKADKPESRMPPFEGKISDKDFTALGAYLASLK